MQLKKLKKIARYAVSGLLMIGVILTLGFLSFASVLAWCGLIGIGILAFTLAGVIEGEVYAQGINAALKKFFNRHHVRDVICLRTLDELLANKNKLESNDFLNDYKKLRKTIHRNEKTLERNKHKEAVLEGEALTAQKTRNEEDEKKLKTVKKDLKLMEHYFQKFILGKLEDKDAKGLNRLINAEEKREILEEISRKTWVSRAIFLISVVAGIGMGLVFLNVAPAGLVSLAGLFGVTLAAAALPQALMIVLFAFAVITAAGYMCLIYKALTNVLEKNLPAWFKTIRTYFERRKGETDFQLGLRIGLSLLAGLVVIGIGIFATVTTAGTWWYAAQAGVTFIAPATAAITWLVNITVGITAAATLIFTLAYSLETIQKLSQLSSDFLSQKWNEFKTKIKKAGNNIPQVIIVLITELFKALAFVGHIVFTGAVGEGSNLLPASLNGLTTAINGTSDLLVDLSAHMHMDEDCEAKDSSHQPLEDSKNHSHEHPDQKHKHSHKHSHAHAHEGHSHEHFDIPEIVCKGLLLPIYILSTLWDFFATPNDNQASYGNAGALFATWANMLKKSWIKCFFGIEASAVLEANETIKACPPLTESYRQTLSVLKITKTLGNLEKWTGLKKEENELFTDLKEKLKNNEKFSMKDIFRQNLETSEGAKELHAKLMKLNPGV